MTIYKLSLITAIFTLIGCQSTSLREVDSDPINQAEYEQNIDKLPSYEAPKEHQLRMYVFTGFEAKKLTNNERDGYYIDFNIRPKSHSEEDVKSNLPSKVK